MIFKSKQFLNAALLVVLSISTSFSVYAMDQVEWGANEPKAQANQKLEEGKTEQPRVLSAGIHVQTDGPAGQVMHNAPKQNEEELCCACKGECDNPCYSSRCEDCCVACYNCFCDATNNDYDRVNTVMDGPNVWCNCASDHASDDDIGIGHRIACCGCVMGICCLPCNLVWRLLTFPCQKSMHCCEFICAYREGLSKYYKGEFHEEGLTVVSRKHFKIIIGSERARINNRVRARLAERGSKNQRSSFPRSIALTSPPAQAMVFQGKQEKGARVVNQQ